MCCIKSTQRAAHWAVEQRNQLKAVYKDLMPPEMIQVIATRNIEKYQNPLGASVEQLLNGGKSWKQTIESRAILGGTALDVVPLGLSSN